MKYEVGDMVRIVKASKRNGIPEYVVSMVVRVQVVDERNTEMPYLVCGWLINRVCGWWVTEKQIERVEDGDV
jgi:hypothetical protein